MKNIILVGFMGTGKTAAAKRLAPMAGLSYISVDDEIIRREGTEINTIFREKGEPYFRTLEKKIIHEISEKNAQVIDTGGGAMIDPANVIALKKNGIIICLWATPEEILNRTSASFHRPLLNTPDPEAKIKELLDVRREFYERADIHINTSGLSVGETVDRIMAVINEEKEKEK